MTTRARQSDRDQTVDALSAAYADAQIDETEHEKRVAKALTARRTSTLDGLLSDLQLANDHAAGKLFSSAPGAAGAGAASDGSTATSRRPEPRRTRRTTMAAVAAACAVCVTAVVVATTQGHEPDPAPLLRAAGYEALVADLDDEFGSSEVLALEMHTTWAYVLVADSTGAGRFQRFTYTEEAGFAPSQDGTIGTAKPRLVDLDDVDPAALIELVQRARGDLGVQDVSDVLVTITDDYRSTAFASTFPDGDPPGHVEVDVSNDFMERAWLAASLDLTVVAQEPYKS